jgi:hypothetical protein
MIPGAFHAPNGLREITQSFQAGFDIFLSLVLKFPSMIDGKVEAIARTQSAQPKMKFFIIAFHTI